jgi:hypothetical protein
MKRKDEPVCKTNKYGYKSWYINGKLHREDGPAVEYADGTKHWCLNGKYHREDGPAVENADGDKFWYLNGKLHRTDGPAVHYNNDDRVWYLNGLPHREDGPAIDNRSIKQWRVHGALHRTDGPALILDNGARFWYINGDQYSEAEFDKIMKKTKPEPVCETDKHGTKRWYLNNQLHREDGPAVEYANGDKYWHLNGKLHREDGPAIEYADGDKEWYINGYRNREDGPAREYANGNKLWYINDKQLTEAEFDKIMKKRKTNEVKPTDTIESLESQIDTLKKKLKVLRDIKKKESLLPQQEKIGRGAEIITEALATSKFNKSFTPDFARYPFLQVRLAGNYEGQGLFLSEKNSDIKWQIVVDNGGCQVLIPVK